MANGSMSGKQTVLMDNRGRISFPASFRSAIGETLFISPDSRYRNILVVRNEEGYNAYKRFIQEEGEKNGDDYEDIEEDVRDFCGDTARVVPDKNGRITLPSELIERADLTSGKAVIIGMVDYAEIWDGDVYAAYEAERRKTREERRRLLEKERAAKRRRKAEEVEQ